MTIDEQSVNAMIPKRTFGVSGESSANAPPAQPFGTPASRPAATELVAVLRKRRRVCFMGSVPLESKLIGRHRVGEAIGFARSRILQKSSRKNVRIAARKR